MKFSPENPTGLSLDLASQRNTFLLLKSLSLRHFIVAQTKSSWGFLHLSNTELFFFLLKRKFVSSPKMCFTFQIPFTPMSKTQWLDQRFQVLEFILSS